LAIIDPTLPDGRRLELADLRNAVASRLDALPRFRQRLATPAFSLARPAWIDVEDFDVRFHVRGVTVSPPGGAGELAAVVGEIIARHIDRSKPLWEIYLVEGLEGGRVAFMLKLHHAIADGLGGIGVARTLLDGTPQTPSFPPSTWRSRPAPRLLQLFAASSKEQLLAPLKLVSDALREWLDAPGPTSRRASEVAVGLWKLAREGRAPRSPLNRPVGPARRFAPVAVDLAASKRVRLAFGATPNEVVLATMAGALQRFFRERGDRPPDRPLRAMIPISVRAQGRRGIAGNWTTAYSFDLSLEPMPAADRLTAIVAATKVRRQSQEPLAARFVMNVAGTWLPQPLHALAARMMYRDKWFNLIVSTMPGTSRATYLAGARLEVAYPILPLVEGVGLTVGAMTWEGRLTFGLTADAAILPDLERLADAVRVSFDDLVLAAESRPPVRSESEPPSGEARPRASASEGRG
jgi:WS/DGAT/MGAT family acyltransferase